MITVAAGIDIHDFQVFPYGNSRVYDPSHDPCKLRTDLCAVNNGNRLSDLNGIPDSGDGFKFPRAGRFDDAFDAFPFDGSGNTGVRFGRACPEYASQVVPAVGFDDSMAVYSGCKPGTKPDH